MTKTNQKPRREPDEAPTPDSVHDMTLGDRTFKVALTLGASKRISSVMGMNLLMGGKNPLANIEQMDVDEIVDVITRFMHCVVVLQDDQPRPEPDELEEMIEIHHLPDILAAMQTLLGLSIRSRDEDEEDDPLAETREQESSLAGTSSEP